MRRFRVRPVGALLALLLVAALPTAPASQSVAAGYGSIAGQVVDDVTGEPVPGVQLRLFRELRPRYWGEVPLSGNGLGYEGRFDMGLAPGTYKVGVRVSENYLERWYGGTKEHPAATEIVVTEGQTHTIQIPVPRAGHISGTVRSGVDAAPIPGAQVTAMVVNDDGFPETVRSAKTKADGTYDIGGLEIGSYRVGFHPDKTHLPEYWDDSSSWANATWVKVTRGLVVPGVDASLAKASHITGRVSFEDGRGPAAGGWVGVYTSGGAELERANIGPDGTFDVAGLVPGSHRVLISAWRSVDEWYKDVTSRAAAAPVVVASGGTTSIGEVLVAPPGSIVGRVTDEQGSPLAGVEVYGYPLGSQVTAADGSFTFSDVAPGSYRLNFDHPDYTPEYFHNAPDYDSATDIVVSPGKDTVGVEAALTKGAIIVGRLTTPDGEPPVSGRAQALRLGPNGWVTEKNADTTESGDFRISGLRSGTYTLAFFGSGHATTFLGGGSRLSVARRFVVEAGEVISGQDGTLALTSDLTGTIRLDGLAMADKWVRVSAVAPDNPFLDGYWDEARTTAGGVYSFNGLQPGRYKLHVYCDVPQLFVGPKELAGVVVVDIVGGRSAIKNVAFPASACQIRPVVAPRLVAATRVGQSLRFRADAYSPGAVRRHYAWAVGTRRIGTTRPELKLLSSFRGKRVTARLIVERRGYEDLVYVFRSGVVR